MIQSTEHNSLSKSIVKTLLYFDIFQYPLTSVEIFKYLPTNHVGEQEVRAELELLVEKCILFKLDNYFSLQNNTELRERRLKGNHLAKKSLATARIKAKLISNFPYVRAVMISGSLSKGYMDEKSDFDFFIVTEKERLWIARTLLVLYKRIFLLNSHKYFCVNYFVDSAHLEIEEKNLFTATELATLIPIVDKGHYSDLMITNKWLATFFPNYSPHTPEDTLPLDQNKTKDLLESVINLFFGKYLEKLFMNITLSRWKTKYEKHYNQSDFEVAFKSKEYVSKNHPNNYQRKVMELYNEKISSFSKLNPGMYE